MSTCCICGKELNGWQFSMPFFEDCEQCSVCMNCYAAKTSLDSGVVDKYLEAREYFLKCMEQGSVLSDMQPRLEAYIQERDSQNEDAIIEHQIRKKFEAYPGSGWAVDMAAMSGSESSEIEKKLIEAKQSAQSKMIRRAIGCGANAVLGIKFDVTVLTSSLIMVSINGTAVEVEKL